VHPTLERYEDVIDDGLRAAQAKAGGHVRRVTSHVAGEVRRLTASSLEARRYRTSRRRATTANGHTLVRGCRRVRCGHLAHACQAAHTRRRLRCLHVLQLARAVRDQGSAGMGAGVNVLASLR
jgi:hypothetical protein